MMINFDRSYFLEQLDEIFELIDVDFKEAADRLSNLEIQLEKQIAYHEKNRYPWEK